MVINLGQMPPKKPSFMQKLGRGLGDATNLYLQQLQGEKAQKMEEEKGRRALEYEYGLKGDLEERKQKTKYAQQLGSSQQELELEKQNYDQIQNTFGKQFADIWKAAPIGGRTELLRQGIEAKLRGHNIEDLLSAVQSS